MRVQTSLRGRRPDENAWDTCILSTRMRPGMPGTCAHAPWRAHGAGRLQPMVGDVGRAARRGVEHKRPFSFAYLLQTWPVENALPPSPLRQRAAAPAFPDATTPRLPHPAPIMTSGATVTGVRKTSPAVFHRLVG